MRAWPAGASANVATSLSASHNDFRPKVQHSRDHLVPSAALTNWQTDRIPRLNEVEAHCAAVFALAPPNPTFLDENLRGFVLHLSAHFQGFCRNLYTECSQIWIAAIPTGLKATAQAQFSAQLALERGNPSHDNIKKGLQPLRVPARLAGRSRGEPPASDRPGTFERLAEQGSPPGNSASRRRSAGNPDASHRARLEGVLRWTGDLARRYHAP